MPRISGVDLPSNKKLEIGLTYLYGVGRANVVDIIKKSEVDRSKRVKDLTDEDIGKIQRVLDKEYKIEGDLRMEVSGNIKRLKEIGSYRGLRHTRNLPNRGQRTRSNARTRRGKRQTVGALKKDIRAKMGAAPEKK